MKFSLRRAVPLIPVGMILVLTSAGCQIARPHTPPDERSTEANITRLTTGMLEQSQFAHHPFDRTLASTLMESYLDSLDGTRSLFLQTDIDDFAAYRPRLAEETKNAGDTSAAQAIFRRYLERLGQQTSYVNDTLRTASFDFTGHDTYSYDREHADRPRDLAAAQALWRQQLRSEYLTEKLRDKTPAQIVRTLTLRHAQLLTTMQTMRSDEVLDIYLDTLAHVYDPHSDYFGHNEMESFSSAMNLSLVGIGASLESTDGYCKIRELLPGGPAERSGLLKPGDRIAAVAEPRKEPVDIVNMPLSRAVPLIRGAKGSTVILSIIPAGAADGAPPKTVALVRDEVALADEEAKAKIVDLPSENGTPLRVGVIDLPSFYADMGDKEGAHSRSATADVTRLLTKLNSEHVQGVVLDLRRDGGGSLREAISLTGLFIRKGPVVQIRDQAGKIDVGADTDPAMLYDGPLVVLTSRYSASASEIMAGALQDYGRALVVGDPSTFGKGTVQAILPLARVMDREHLAHTFDPGALKITTSKFYRPSGASTQLRGVASDIVVPSTTDLGDVSESTLKAPLPWDTVPPTRYEAWNRVAPYVDALRAKSAQRVAAEKPFNYVADELARLRNSSSRKSVSLNEAERRAELVQSRTQREEAEREERTLLATNPPTYRITLANAAQPSLPAPTTTADAPRKADRAAADDPDRLAPGQLAEEMVLHESEEVLADYIDLLPKLPPTAATR